MYQLTITRSRNHRYNRYDYQVKRQTSGSDYAASYGSSLIDCLLAVGLTDEAIAGIAERFIKEGALNNELEVTLEAKHIQSNK